MTNREQLFGIANGLALASRATLTAAPRHAILFRGIRYGSLVSLSGLFDARRAADAACNRIGAWGRCTWKSNSPSRTGWLRTILRRPGATVLCLAK